MPVRPSQLGPYLPENGADAYGHFVNGYGRCEQLNTIGVCPNADQQTAYLTSQDNDIVVEMAEGLGIAIPPVHTNAILVPLIIAIQFP